MKKAISVIHLIYLRLLASSPRLLRTILHNDPDDLNNTLPI